MLTTKHIMPTIPWAVFGIAEPIVLMQAAYAIWANPHDYHAKLGPRMSAYTPSGATESSILALANCFLFVGAAQFICCHVSKEPIIPRMCIGYEILADWIHIWTLYKGMGHDAFVDYTNWNDVVWGGVVGSLVLNVLRFAYLFGVFGKDDEELLWREREAAKVKSK